MNLREFRCHEHATGRKDTRGQAEEGDPRSWAVRRVAGLSHDLTMTPEEYVGRYGHGHLVGGVPELALDDTEAPPGYAEWTAMVNALLSDPAAQRSLRRQYLTEAELAEVESRTEL